MTPKQKEFYWSMWGKVRKKLIADGMDSILADEERKAFHVRAGVVDSWGEARSSKDLTNDEFDRIRAEFQFVIFGKAVAHRHNGDDRARHSLYAKHLLDCLEIENAKREDYLNGIALQMTGNFLAKVTDMQWRDILAALKTHLLRQNRWRPYTPPKKPPTAKVLNLAPPAAPARPVTRQPSLAGLDMTAQDQMLH